MTGQLFGIDGVYDPDIRARRQHQSSIDVFRGRGGTPPRKGPEPVVREIRAGDVVKGDRWTLTVGHAAHVQPYLECLAFRIDGDGGSLCYSGDSGPCDALVELARGCDVLIHMNHYFSGREPSPSFRAACGNHRDNAALARRAGVKTLVLTHLTSEIDRPDVREQILREIREDYDGQVIWGQDLMEIPIGSNLTASALRRHSPASSSPE